MNSNTEHDGHLRDADTLLKAERTRLKTIVDGDLPALGAMLADDLVYVHSSGARDTRSTYLDKLSTGLMRYHTAELNDASTLALGDGGTVTYTFRAEVEVNGELRTVGSHAVAVWAVREDRPVLVYFQSTSLG